MVSLERRVINFQVRLVNGRMEYIEMQNDETVWALRELLEGRNDIIVQVERLLIGENVLVQSSP